MIINFGYVIDDKLAGLAHPDTFGDVTSALTELHDRGIRAVVSLDENGIRPGLAAEHAMEYLHIPIPDFNAPKMEQADEFVEFVHRQLDADAPVAVHCRGGYGRTGTLIACYLISQGMPAAEAIELVRKRRPGSIETAGQEKFLLQFERHYQKKL